MQFRTPLIAFLAALVIATIGCTSPDDSSSESTVQGGVGTDVSIVNFAFEPADVAVSVGDSVIWTNTASATHTSTAVDGGWDVRLDGGESVTQTFDAAGTFEYFCAIHPSMTGTVTVNG